MRLLAMLVVVPATYHFVYWVPFAFVPFLEQRSIPAVVSLLCAIAAGRYVWRRLGSTPRGLISSMVFTGPLGFLLGGAVGAVYWLTMKRRAAAD